MFILRDNLGVSQLITLGFWHVSLIYENGLAQDGTLRQNRNLIRVHDTHGK